jgi:hypothetical protein
MLLHLHEIDRLPIPTKVSAEFKRTVCTKRNLIEPVQVSPTSVKRFRILFKTPLFFITVIMPIATLNLGTIKICEFLLFVSFLLCSVLSFSSYLSLLFVMSFLLPNFLFFSTFLVTFFHFFFFSLSIPSETESNAVRNFQPSTPNSLSDIYASQQTCWNVHHGSWNLHLPKICHSVMFIYDRVSWLW